MIHEDRSIAARGGRRRSGVAAIAGLATVLWAGVPAPAAVGGDPIEGEPVQFIVDVGGSCINGSATADLAFRFVQLGATGKPLRAVDIVATDGYWATCDGPLVRAGQTLVARKDGVALHTLVVPRLSIASDRVTDVLKGTGPAGEQVDFKLIHCFPGATGCAEAVEVSPRQVGPDGRYTVDVTDLFDVRGNDITIAHWGAPSGDDVYARTDAPAMEVRSGRALVFGDARPGTTVVVRLLSSGGALRAKGSATVATHGYWSVTVKRDGKAVRTRVGDRVTAGFAPDASLRVRAIDANADLGADTITGTCHPNGEVGVQAYTADSEDGEPQHTTTDGTGAWSTSGWTVLEHGSHVSFWCATAKGDLQAGVRVVP